jgi:serine/threonine-protein kinase RsbT
VASSNGSLELRSEEDIVRCRQAVRRLTQELKFSLVDQTKIVTAASELSRNTVTYGRGGEMRWESVADGARTGLRLVFEDNGPGIADVAQALTDGWTSGGGLGMGLSGSRRLMHEFDLQSVVGQGTRVTITRWK